MLVKESLYKGLTLYEKQIVDDILSINEDKENLLDKLKNYGKKGMLTAAILLSLAGSLKANVNDATKVIKTGIEYIEKDEKQKMTINSLIGYLKILQSQFMKNGEVEKAGAAKVLLKYYLEYKDGNKPELPKEEAGINMEKFKKAVFNSYKKLSYDEKIKFAVNYASVIQKPN